MRWRASLRSTRSTSERFGARSSVNVTSQFPFDRLEEVAHLADGERFAVDADAEGGLVGAGQVPGEELVQQGERHRLLLHDGAEQPGEEHVDTQLAGPSTVTVGPQERLDVAVNPGAVDETRGPLELAAPDHDRPCP